METQRLFGIDGSSDFHLFAMEVFRFQYRNNPVYREFCANLGRQPSDVKKLADIPFLPIEFFKSHRVQCGMPAGTTKFFSSGTTFGGKSIHYVSDVAVYERSYQATFELFYGPVSDYCILALLPSYLERKGSSLIYMVRDLIQKTGNPDSGFYLHELDLLKDKLLRLEATKTKTLLIGVSFALLDFASQFRLNLKHTTIMETGGMKGRKKELVREELHGLLKEGFGVSAIHSEYGMTELLSQAYSRKDGMFCTPPWMKVCIRDPEDPLSYLESGKTGGMNIIDLANINSCSFIATQDLGKFHSENQFEILGRFDNSDIRGCNLMVI